MHWTSTPAVHQKAGTLELGSIEPATRTRTRAAPAGLVFSLALSNTGSMDAAKTVQLYITQTNVPDAPNRQLAGLAKVFVKASATVITFTTPSNFVFVFVWF